jgi:hypothetical protein
MIDVVMILLVANDSRFIFAQLNPFVVYRHYAIISTLFLTTVGCRIRACFAHVQSRDKAVSAV